MREIKFRAFHKRLNKMFTVLAVDFKHCLINALSEEDTTHTFGFIDIDLIENTSLKDSSGKEIYDRDLWLPLGCETPRVVKWYKNGWWLHHLKTDMPLRLLEWAEDGEIIGNIYQNPELLGTTS